MRRFITAALAVALATGCTSTGDEGGDTIDRGMAADAKADGADLCWIIGMPEGCDLCAELGWYSDGICDTFCDLPDEDCEEPPSACGGFMGLTCEEGEYCDYEENSCGFADQMGECRPRPGDCMYADPSNPVCGCNGSSYPTDCHANADGVDISGYGACEEPPAPCGGFMGLTCEGDEYCDYAENSCGFADQMGECRPRPGDCMYADPSNPVCGCNGSSYPTDCHANADGVDISGYGACEPTCPDPSDPRVSYIGDSFEDPTTCYAIRFTCDEGQSLFSDECGCGCIDDCADGERLCEGCPGAAGFCHSADEVCPLPECPAPAEDCRDTGCEDGQYCTFCWTEFLCIPEGAVC